VGIDEMIARYTQAGERSFLTDALGSVIALAKEDQSIATRYAYSPYGQSQASGAQEGNASQYTARENDATGLYYYRARYYDAVLKRFVSEDPIGLAGGINVYGYVDGDPINLTDPLGLQGGTNPTSPPFGPWQEQGIEGVYPEELLPFVVGGVVASSAAQVAREVFGPVSTRTIPPELEWLAKYRDYIRYDRTHHGKPPGWDGRISNMIRRFWGPSQFKTPLDPVCRR
jgi:RHS repeat-associated protein